MEHFLPSRQEIGAYLAQLTDDNKAGSLSAVAREAVIDSADIALTVLTTNRTLGREPKGGARECAAAAANALLAMYKPWMDPGDPEACAEFVHNPEFLRAFTTVGCLAAALRERQALEEEGSAAHST